MCDIAAEHCYDTEKTDSQERKHYRIDRNCLN
jgi:hypothetical protein